MSEKRLCGLALLYIHRDMMFLERIQFPQQIRLNWES